MLLLPILSARLPQSLCHWNSKIFRYCANHPNIAFALEAISFSWHHFVTQKILKRCIVFLFKHLMWTLATYKLNPHTSFSLMFCILFIFRCLIFLIYYGKHPNKLSKMKYMFWFFLFLKNLQMYSYSHLMVIYSSLCSTNES